MLEALRMEWRLAWWCLPDKFRKQMRLPGFEIREMESRWGAWHGDRKLLVMNSRLMRTTTWPCIREVLRHEMAHQFADEVFLAAETSHGDQFREACRLLNADPRASGSLPSIHQWIHEHGGAADPRVERVRKLLALASSPHPHEAEAAMLKAHELMIRFNIDPLRSAESEYVSMCIGSPAVRHTTADDALAAILRDFYFVETIYVPIIVPKMMKRGKILEISGTGSNVRMAAYIHDFLGRSILEQAAAKGIKLKRVRNDYATGFLKGIADMLTSQASRMSAPSATSALIKESDTALRLYFRKRHPRLRTRYYGGRSMDETAYRSGLKDGRNLVIHKPIESGPARRRMLPGWEP